MTHAKLPHALLFLLGTTSNATTAEDAWTRIVDADELRALFSDVILIGELSGGVKARATYNSDGSAELQAWGGTFPRTWHVSDDAQICIEFSNSKECSSIDRSSAADQYRERNLTTGEEAIFAIGPNLKEATEIAANAPSASVSPSVDEIARELANPNTALAKLTLKTQFRTFTGELPGSDNQDAVSMLFQPSAPIPLKRKGDSILFRPAFPIFIDQPFFDADNNEFDSDFALGDIGFDLAYSRTTPGGLLFAGGIIATLPTATKDELGKDLWSAGPEILIGKITNTYVLGAFPNHQWDFAGDGDGDVSLTSSQFFGIYLPGGGWSVGSAPIITYDWKIDEWTAPINLSLGKTEIFGGRPWKIGFEINYYADQPDAFGPEWMVGIDITPVVQNKLVQWLKN
jgi:hypothetical protein